MSSPSLQVSPQQTTPQRSSVGSEGFLSTVHRHLQYEQYPEACKAAREILAESADPLQVNALMASFQQKIAVIMPSLSEFSLDTTKSVSMLLETLVTLAACSDDDHFFGVIFSSNQDYTSSSLLMQHAARVVGCSVHILDDIFQQTQNSGENRSANNFQAVACDILDLCQVLEQCVGLHSIVLQRLKQASLLQNNSWGCVIVGSIRVVKAGLDQIRLHKLIQSKPPSNSDQSLDQALIPLENLYQACHELLSETFALLSVFLERSKPHNIAVLAELCDEIVPLCQDNQLRMSVKNVLWRAFIPFCTNPSLCDSDCRWNRLKVVESLLSEVSDRTQSILNSVRSAEGLSVTFAGQVKALRFFLGHLSKFADAHNSVLLQAPHLLKTLLELRGIISPLGHNMRIGPDDQKTLDVHVVPLVNGIIEFAFNPLPESPDRSLIKSLEVLHTEFKNSHEAAGSRLCYAIAARKVLLSHGECEDAAAISRDVISRLMTNLDQMLSASLLAFADELPRVIEYSPSSFALFNSTLDLVCTLCKSKSQKILNFTLNELIEGLISQSVVVSFLCASALDLFSRQCTTHQVTSMLRSLHLVMQNAYEENVAQCFSCEQYRIARLIAMICCSHDGEATAFLRSALSSKSVFASCASLSCASAILHWLPLLGNFVAFVDQLYMELLPVCCSRLSDLSKKDCVPIHTIMPILSVAASVLRLCQGPANAVPNSRPVFVGNIFDSATLMLQKAVSSNLQECSEFSEVCVAAAVAAIGTGHVSCSHVCGLISFVNSKCPSYLKSNHGVVIALTQIISACAAVVILPSEAINMSASLAKFTSL